MNHENTLLPVPGPGDLPETLPALPTHAGPPQEPLKKVISVMRGRWKWAVASALVLAVAGAVGGYLYARSKLVYASVGMVRVVSNPKRILPNVIVDTAAPTNFEMIANTHVITISSNRILRLASNHPEFKGVDTSQFPDAVAFIRKGLKVTRKMGSEMIEIQFSHPDPEVARQVAVAVFETYMTIEGEKDLKDTTDRFNKLQRQRTDTEAELKNLAAQRAEITGVFKAPNIEVLHAKRMEGKEMLARQLEQLRLALSAQGVDLDALHAEQAAPPVAGGPDPAAKDGVVTEEEVLTAEAIAAQDPDMKKLIDQRSFYEVERERLIATLGARHRDVKRLEGIMLYNEKRIEERLAEFQALGVALPFAGDAPQSLDGAKRRYLEVRQALAQTQAEVESLYAAIERLAVIQDDEKYATEKLQGFKREIDNLAVERDDIQRVEGRFTPELEHEPAKDRRVLMAVAGTLFGGGAGFGLVLLVGLLDRRLRSIDDAHESFAKTPMLGILPTLPENLADPEQAAVASHCVHQIRTLLQIGPDSQGRRVFTITSPTPQSGKTSLTLALGLSYAATGAKTLLIDCDLGFGGLSHRMNKVIRRKIGQVLLRDRLVTAHQLEQAMHLARESNRRIGETLVDLGYLSGEDLASALNAQEQSPVGLLDVIGGESLDHCVTETGIDHLSLLPSGSVEPQHVARFSPSALQRMLDQARAMYDVVLIDTGSVLGSLEASHMAVESDGVILVLSRGEDKSLAQQALTSLYSIGARVAGLVFNRAEGADVRAVSERSAGSIHSRPGTNGDRVKPGDAPRMGPIAGAVASSANRTRRF